MSIVILSRLYCILTSLTKIETKKQHKKSEYFGIDMILFMTVCIQALEGFFSFKAFTTKEKVVTILAHVAVLDDFYFACETFIFFIIVDLGFKNDLHLMIWLMIP